MLKIILSGYVGNDATIKEVGNQKAINFDIAVSRDYKNNKGEKVERTEWIRAAIWKKRESETNLADYLKKGTKVLIEGEPTCSAYTSQTGEAKSSINVTVKEIELLG
ncbi:single-stranded DNA-binding protein [Saccharicrinis aurantiacus]|uniref:single-stranded DNA-binding protein n=1 Tax=Saccharicrinis aurantiacus TaxID=1849719 RepID=UPI000839627B|nr:single-stranded DNA-binding protein [Saccharicrinis aurantiacus]